MAVKTVIKKRAKKAPAKKAAVEKAAKKAPVKKKATAKKAAVKKKATAKKAPVKKKATAKKAPTKKTTKKSAPKKAAKTPTLGFARKKVAMKKDQVGNFQVDIQRSYYSFHDLFDGEYFEEYWLTDPTMQDVINSEEGLAVFWSDGGDAQGIVETADYLVLHYEEVTITPFGSCTKCKHKFSDLTSAFTAMFCTECGTQRVPEQQITFTPFPKDFNRVLKKNPHFESTQYSAAVRDHFEKYSLGRYMTRNAWIERTFSAFNTTIEEIESSFGDDTNWDSEDSEISSYSDGAALLGICAERKKSFAPLEKFCSKCGGKQTWFDGF